MGSTSGSEQNKPMGVAEETIPVDLEKVPVRIDKIHIQGLSRTKDDFVAGAVQELFKVKTFNDMVIKAGEGQRRLEKLGCFRNVGIIIDTSKGPDATSDGYEIIYSVEETGRFIGGINTMVGANEGSVVLGCRLPNLVGRGERVNIEHTIGSQANNSTMVSFMKPINEAWNADFTATAFHHKIPNYCSGFTLSSSGGLLDFAFQAAEKVKHNMQFEGTWRLLEVLGGNTSFSVREQSGHRFKSALRHILNVDYRDHLIFPTTGLSVKLVHELAGLGGDVAFAKHDSEFQINIPLPLQLVLQGAARFGILGPFGAKVNKVQTHNISDMFFLGGPQMLRGFEMKSLGTRSRNDALGGKVYWSTALHLYSPLPFNVGRGGFGDLLRIHIFLNAGNISDSSSENRSQNFKALLSTFRAAGGIGLAMRFGQLARVELNYCWPFLFLKGDQLTRGVQLGLGIDFL